MRQGEGSTYLNGGAVDDLAARKVEQVHVGLAFGQRLRVDEMVGDTLYVRHVDGDVVRLLGRGPGGLCLPRHKSALTQDTTVKTEMSSTTL